MAIQCNECSTQCDNSEAMKSHRRDYHVAKVFYGAGETTLERSEEGFTCPVCEKTIGTTRSFIAHLKNHDLSASYARKRKRSNSAIEPDGNTQTNELIKCTIRPVDSNKNPYNDILSDDDDLPHIPPSPLSLKTKTSTPSRLTYRHTVLAASDCLTCDQTTQDDKVMLAKLGRWTPLVYEYENQHHGLLTSTSTASILLQTKTTIGRWSSPINDDMTGKSTNNVSDDDHFIQHIKTTSKASTKLLKTKHKEKTKEECKILNEDWLLYPQLRYCTSQLLAGAILMESGKAIMINTIEPYARDTQLDAHHEKKYFGSASSFPSTAGPYGYLSICVLLTSDGQKLVIGTRTCNFLVTSSFRLDCVSVNLGPTTSHFTPSEYTRVFLDMNSIALTNDMLSDSNINRSQSLPILYMLRQLRSKFDHLSTYTMCRSSSTIASQLQLQPTSIWILSDQESNHTTMSQERIGSMLFRNIASQVIKHGKYATLDIQTIRHSIATTKDGSSLSSILASIENLFGENEESIEIIGNTALNNQLVDLAGSISNKHQNDKIIAYLTKCLYN